MGPGEGVACPRPWETGMATYCLGFPASHYIRIVPVGEHFGRAGGGRRKNVRVTDWSAIIPVRKIIRFTFISPKHFCYLVGKNEDIIILSQVLSFLRFSVSKSLLKLPILLSLSILRERKFLPWEGVFSRLISCQDLKERQTSVLHPQSRDSPPPSVQPVAGKGLLPL